MGQVIAFPVPPAPRPYLVADLGRAESVLLLAIRWWVECRREGEDPIPRLLQGLGPAGAADAAFSIDSLMTVVARAGTRSIDISCPWCAGLSPDETHLLRAARLAQGGSGDLAARVLRTTLLSAQGADFAIGPLEGLGRVFAQARLLLSGRRLPAGGGDGRESWLPPHFFN